jgi:hypothetical protein
MHHDVLPLIVKLDVEGVHRALAIRRHKRWA